MAAIIETAMTRVVAEIQAQLSAGESPPAHKYGAKYLDENSSPPRIVWERMDGDYSPPPSVGGKPKSICTNNVSVRVHIWGRTEEEADQMSETELSAMHRCFGSGVQPVDQQVGAANKNWLAKGFALVDTVKIPLVVQNRITPVARINSIEQEGELL